MTKPVRVEDAARNELRAIVAWYEDRRSGLGRECLADIERTLQLIQRHPKLGRVRSTGANRTRHAAPTTRSVSLRNRLPRNGSRDPNHRFRP